MAETTDSEIRSGPTFLSKTVGIPIVVGLTLLFILLRFPWDSLANRIAWEISSATGSAVSIDQLAPAVTARGPVLRARDVVFEHPAVDRVRLHEFEIAPRWSSSWLSGEPALRIWADSPLGIIDGILRVGEISSFVGRISDVELAGLPLRLDASGVDISGRIEADADIVLDPNGTLSGRVAFLSPSIVVESNRMPMALAFTNVEGVIVILENGATRIESVVFEGETIEGNLSGEIGLVHHSVAPPIDLDAHFRIIDPLLRRLAAAAGISMSSNGDVAARIYGSLDAPLFEQSPGRDGRTRNSKSRNQPKRNRE